MVKRQECEFEATFSRHLFASAGTAELYACLSIEGFVFGMWTPRLLDVTTIRWTIEDVERRHRDAQDGDFWESEKFQLDSSLCTLRFHPRGYNLFQTLLNVDYAALELGFEPHDLMQYQVHEAKVTIEDANGVFVERSSE